MRNKINFLSTRPWLWKGTREDIKSPGRACLIAPLFALAPPLAFILCIGAYRLIVLGNLELGNNQGWLTLLFGGGMTLAISYGVTILVGLPWFLALSWIGWGGLLPVISASVFPLFYIWSDSMVRGRQAPIGFYLFFLVCGLLPATIFWKIIRKP